MKYNKNDSKQNKIDNLNFLILFITSFVLMFLSVQRISDPLKKMGSSLFKLGNSFLVDVGSKVNNNRKSRRYLKELKIKYTTLKTQYDKFYKKEIEIEALEDENTKLRKVLDLSKKIEYSNTPAKIISRDITPSSNIFTIDKGQNKDIEKDMVVISYKDGKMILVGKVIEVSKSTSKVVPIYDNNFYINCKLKDNRYNGILNRGQKDKYNYSTITFYNINEKIDKKSIIEDEVETSPMGNIYPSGISIGMIEEIYKDLNEHLKAKVKLYVDLKDLEDYVYILIRK